MLIFPIAFLFVWAYSVLTDESHRRGKNEGEKEKCKREIERCYILTERRLLTHSVAANEM